MTEPRSIHQTKNIFLYFLWMHRLALRISKLQKDARLEYDPVNKSRLVRMKKKKYNKASRNHGQWVQYWFSCFWFLSFNIFCLFINFHSVQRISRGCIQYLKIVLPHCCSVIIIFTDDMMIVGGHWNKFDWMSFCFFLFCNRFLYWLVSLLYVIFMEL